MVVLLSFPRRQMNPEDQAILAGLKKLAMEHPEWHEDIVAILKEAQGGFVITEPKFVSPTHKEMPMDFGTPNEERKDRSDRMRQLGRVLMMAGMRAPRQQMYVMAAVISMLIEDLEKIAGADPGLRGLKRRILMSLRNRVISRV